MDESIAAAIRRLRGGGLTAADMQALLDNLFISPSSPPTPPRPSAAPILTKLRRIRDALHEFDFHYAHRLRRGRRCATRCARRSSSLWQSDDTRWRQPTVLDEVRNGLYFFDDVLFDLAPQLYRELDAPCSATTPAQPFRIPAFLRFGSWIGGDRDGNPFVTVGVTEETLREQKARALRLYQRAIDRMHGHLSVVGPLRHLRRAGSQPGRPTPQLFPDEALRLAARYPMQPYRHKMAYIYRKLAATLEANDRPWRADHLPRPTTYERAEEFIADLRLIQDSLRSHRGGAAGRWPAGHAGAPGRDLRLPPRHAWTCASTPTATRRPWPRFSPATGWPATTPRCPKRQKVALLTAELLSPRPLAPARLDFSEETNETLELFRLIRRAHERVGPQRDRELHHQHDDARASDVLGVLLMAKDAGVADRLDIVPLFETIADLQAAPGIMEQLFAQPGLRRPTSSAAAATSRS